MAQKAAIRAAIAAEPTKAEVVAPTAIEQMTPGQRNANRSLSTAETDQLLSAVDNEAPAG
ncbi:hypothetical protein [Kribbella speibonae]|uniref:Uncharacterized protein n=1 Tax=Kribbella speibonae TaxID=1572660 RepID=A0A4R0IEQ1_9ACTN|nr:hypothetical protein [Kribbella speibonae]TCC29676.1 hypothetical protein E0H92_42450 [Kribbella speibonae]